MFFKNKASKLKSGIFKSGINYNGFNVCMLSCFSRVQLFATPWTVALQAPLSMRFSKQEYWSGLPFPTPGDLPDPGIEPTPLMFPALAGRFSTANATWEAPVCISH